MESGLPEIFSSLIPEQVMVQMKLKDHSEEGPVAQGTDLFVLFKP